MENKVILSFNNHNIINNDDNNYKNITTNIIR